MDALQKLALGGARALYECRPHPTRCATPTVIRAGAVRTICGAYAHPAAPRTDAVLAVGGVAVLHALQLTRDSVASQGTLSWLGPD